tara:strand:+ start:128 stop:655 length:528 start_codon:yes stop_codon:yes gene_type:complete
MLDRIISEVQDWSKRVLEQTRDDIHDWPICPYAKGAWEANAAKVALVDDWRDVLQGVQSFVESKYAVQILVKVEPDDWDMDQFLDDIHRLNRRWASKNVCAIGLHPWDENTFIATTTENDEELDLHDEYVFVLLFRLDELNIASKALEEDGFYEHWRPELYYEILARRKRYEGLD